MRGLSLVAWLLFVSPTLAQDFTGHGGPVGALDVAGDRLISGSFDTRAILWDLGSSSARNVTRFHDGNVTAVSFLPDGGFVTAGQDGRIAIWQPDGRAPDMVTPPGVAAIASLAVSPDGMRVAAGLWDGQVQVLERETGLLQSHQAHRERVTGLAFFQSGDLVSVGGDLRLVRWGAAFTPQASADLPDLPNGLAISEERVAVIFAEGALRLFSPEAELLPERFLTDRPLVSVSAHGGDLAAAAIDGTVWLLRSSDLFQRAVFQAAEGPVWALALDESQVFTAGAEATIRRWSLADGSPVGDAPEAVAPDYRDDSRGFEVWQACAVCHSLQPGDHARAGPSLHGIFGQPIASQPGYDYSEALRDLDLIWTPQTVAELFEYGPEAYTPGSRMPEQLIANPTDREALVAFMARAIAATPLEP